ncbi:hypothetical protein Tco_0229912 [Tanacetum coccineum]
MCKDQLSSGIFTSSSYDDDFSATLTNLAPTVEVNPVPTKRVNTIHPQSQILGDLASPVLTTRSRAHKSKFGEKPMPTIPTQSPFTYPNPNPSASPSFTQDDTFMPESIQPMPTFTQTAFSQPAVHTQHTHPAQTNPTGQ